MNEVYVTILDVRMHAVQSFGDEAALDFIAGFLIDYFVLPGCATPLYVKSFI